MIFLLSFSLHGLAENALTRQIADCAVWYPDQSALYRWVEPTQAARLDWQDRRRLPLRYPDTFRGVPVRAVTLRDVPREVGLLLDLPYKSAAQRWPDLVAWQGKPGVVPGLTWRRQLQAADRKNSVLVCQAGAGPEN